MRGALSVSVGRRVMSAIQGNAASVRQGAVLAVIVLTTGCLQGRHGSQEGGLQSYQSAPGATVYFAAGQRPASAAFYENRVAEQGDPEPYEEATKNLRFTLESNAIDYAVVGTDRPIGPRAEFAVPMGVVNGRELAVLTSRCLIDYRYPLTTDRPDPRFRNLALFNMGPPGSQRNVFKLGRHPERPDLSDVRDPRSEHWIATNRLHLEGPLGSRYFDDLARERVPGVRAELVDGQWTTADGIDLVMLYFPLADAGVGALRPDHSLGIGDPMAVVRTAMAGRSEYLGTFKFNLITPKCMRQAQQQQERAQSEIRFWQGVAVVAATVAILPLLGPAAGAMGASSAGLVGLSGKVALATGKAIASKIVAGAVPASWRVFQRTLAGEELSEAFWDESGRLVIGAVVGGVSKRFALAGVHRGSSDGAVAQDVLTTVRRFVGNGTRLVVQTSPGHPDVASIMQPNSGTDLAAELLARGLAALDLRDLQTVARQSTLLKAAAFALQGTRGPAVMDPNYQNALREIHARAGI